MTTVTGQIKKQGVGGPGAPDIAWQTDQYIIGDAPSAFFTPPFTYHTYRYMEIRGLKASPELSDIRGLFLHSEIPHRSSFSTSSDLLNAIQDAVVRTFQANLVSVQSDCPAREKFGYGGDLNATSESFICNFDMQAFYRKTIYDWMDAMKDSSFVDTAPFTGIEYCGISWESAFLITQYYLYLYYNDTAIVRELYEYDKRWMDKVAAIHPEGIINAGLSDHESLEPVPVQLTGTGHYLQCARIMRTFAGLMGEREDQARYAGLADHLKGLMKARFWDQPVEGKINRQTLFSTLLYHKVIPEPEMAAAADSLVHALKKGPAGHFNTGIFGTKYILETLSEAVSPQLVFDIVHNETFPGWGFMIKRGATTIWETWKESDNTFSNCHPMFGTVTEWYYRWLGGIRPDPESPGFGKFHLSPFVPDGLDHVNCTYDSPCGKIVSNWQKTGEGSIRFEMHIPEGSEAVVDLPWDSYRKVDLFMDGELMDPRGIQDMSSGLRLEAGKYELSVSTH
jgi:alpha-L-rhamnosidase